MLAALAKANCYNFALEQLAEDQQYNNGVQPYNEGTANHIKARLTDI